MCAARRDGTMTEQKNTGQLIAEADRHAAAAGCYIYYGDCAAALSAVCRSVTACCDYLAASGGSADDIRGAAGAERLCGEDSPAGVYRRAAAAVGKRGGIARLKAVERMLRRIMRRPLKFGDIGPGPGRACMSRPAVCCFSAARPGRPVAGRDRCGCLLAAARAMNRRRCCDALAVLSLLGDDAGGLGELTSALKVRRALRSLVFFVETLSFVTVALGALPAGDGEAHHGARQSDSTFSLI